MRLVVRLAAALVALAVPGQTAAPPAPLPQSLSPAVTVSSYGAIGDPARDATSAFEASLSRAGQLAARPATSGSPPTALVRLPAGVHAISRPLFVPSGVDLVGDGWSTRIEMAGMSRLPALVYGVADPAVGTADRPDLFGILDATAAPRPGVRRGWSTHRGLALQGQFTSANLGPWHDGARTYWDGVTCFTLDVALVRPEGGWPPSTPLLGCGRSIAVNDPRPWTLWTSPWPGYLCLSLATRDRPIGIAVDSRGNGSVMKLSIEVDLAAGTVGAWLDGLAVAPLVDGLKPGMALQANDVWPLHVGRQGFAVATSSEPPTPFVLAGLRLGTARRYRSASPGSTQLQLDGKPVTDAYRYFDRTDQRSTVGYLPLDDPVDRRWLRWVDGDSLDECLLAMRGGQGGGKPQRLSDLAVWSRGPAVLLGAVLDWRGANLRLQSETAAAVGSIPMVMSYPITLSGCTLLGGDAAASLSQALVALRDCKIESQGRDGIRLLGASLDATNTFASFCPPQGRTFLRSIAGSEGDVVIRLDRSILDFEDRGPSEALIVVQAEPQHPTTLRIRDLSAALTGPTPDDPRPIVRLEGTGGRASIDGIASGPRSGVVAGGAGWSVAITGESGPSSAPVDLP